MESKYILLGINLIITAVILGIISVASNQYNLLGVSSSIIIFGFTSLAVGFSYREPSMDFLVYYASFIRNNFLRVIEDLDLLDHKLFVIPGEKESYIVLSKDEMDDVSLESFIGYSEKGQYMVLKVDKLVSFGESEVDPEVFLRSKIVDNYMLASSVYVVRENNVYRVTIGSVNSRFVEVFDRPLSPFSLLVCQIVAESLKKKVRFLDEEYDGDNLSLVLEVVSG